MNNVAGQWRAGISFFLCALFVMTKKCFCWRIYNAPAYTLWRIKIRALKQFVYTQFLVTLNK